MTVKATNEKDYTASVHIFDTTTKKDIEKIFVEFVYHDIENGKYYRDIFPASLYDKVCKLYYSINRREIPKIEIPEAIKSIRRSKAK